MTTELPEMYETPSSNAYSAVCARADVTGSPMWRALIDHQRTLETAHLRELFAEDPGPRAGDDGRRSGSLRSTTANTWSHAIPSLCS